VALIFWFQIPPTHCICIYKGKCLVSIYYLCIPKFPLIAYFQEIFFVDSFGFYAEKIMLYANKILFLPSQLVYLLFHFLSLYKLSRISKTMLRYDERVYPCFVPHLSGKSSGLSCLNIMLTKFSRKYLQGNTLKRS
jgi:hypothetical protein